MTTRDIRDEIDNSPMSATQIVAVIICLLINMIDGFDVLVIAFTAPEIAKEWNTSMQALGVLFSSGLVGMAAGSLFVAPLADKLGRRPLILYCLIVICLSMLVAAHTTSVTELAVIRMVTGLGIGGALAALTTVVAEYSSKKRRGLAISVLMTGYPIGATLGGLAAVFINMEIGWRAVFLFGGILPALMIPLALWKLPESIAFLVEKRPKDALKRTNDLLAKMGHQILVDLPQQSAPSNEVKTPASVILDRDVRKSTLLLWTSFFMVMLSFYFVMSWTPKLLVSSGFQVAAGMSTSVIINFGGIIGGLLLGFFAGFFAIKKLLTFYMLSSALAIAGFGLLLGDMGLLLAVGFIVGFFINGSMIGLYTIGPELYPTMARSTGMGWAIGMGRLGAIAGPFVAGVFLDSGWEIKDCFIVFSGPFLIAVVTANLIRLPGSKRIDITYADPGTISEVTAR